MNKLITAFLMVIIAAFSMVTISMGIRLHYIDKVLILQNRANRLQFELNDFLIDRLLRDPQPPTPTKEYSL